MKILFTLLFVGLTIFISCQKHKNVEYNSTGNEFSVTFYDKPNIQSSQAGDFLKFETASVVLPDEYSFQRCESFLISGTLIEQINEEYVFNVMREYARFQGVSIPTMHYEVTDLGKMGTLRAYKELEDENGKVREITYYAKAVFGEKSGVILYVGSPSENFPTPEISKFLNSIKKISLKSDVVSVESLDKISPIINDEVINEISKAYGFYIGQNHALDLISKKFESLKNDVQLAQLNFERSFENSIIFIDSTLRSQGMQWEDVKLDLTNNIKSSVNIDKLRRNEAQEFITLVNKRSRGEIPNPVIGSLLTFNPKYLHSPSSEFKDGYTYRFSGKGHTKSKGLDFHIDIPKSWSAEEANRPNIVQIFRSQNGHGLAMLMILIKNLPGGVSLTEKDVRDLSTPDEIKEAIPPESDFIKGGFIKIDNIPGIYQEYVTEQLQLHNKVQTHNGVYSIYYNNYMIQLLLIVGDIVDENQENVASIFNKYESLFNLVAGSLVIQSQWTQ